MILNSFVPGFRLTQGIEAELGRVGMGLSADVPDFNHPPVFIQLSGCQLNATQFGRLAHNDARSAGSVFG